MLALGLPSLCPEFALWLPHKCTCKGKMAVLYLQWTKRTEKQKQPERVVHFLLQKSIMKNERQLESNDSGLALFSCNQFEETR